VVLQLHPAGDADGSGDIAVNEMTQAVNNEFAR
jgi:hypothetical protein